MAIYVADTYAWMAYFDKSEAYRDLIEKNIIKTPALVFSELSRTLKRRGLEDYEIDKLFEFMEKHSLILDFDLKLGIMAGKLSDSDKLPLMDSILYRYASSEAPFLTGDEHFRGKPNVHFVKEK
ncbi:MAG: PIN domain-containing protein [Candidatus Micrarchaeota archaeon]